MNNPFRNYQQKTAPKAEESIEKPKYLPPNHSHPFLRKMLTLYNLAFPLLHALFTLLLLSAFLLIGVQFIRGLFFLEIEPVALVNTFPKSSLFFFLSLLLFSLNALGKRIANGLAIKLQ